MVRALIVDDDEPIRSMLATIVKHHGFCVETASDGDQAIASIAADGFDVVLLDLMMPRVDGFQVIDYLRKHPPAVKPVVLVITAYADQRFKKVDPDIVAGVIRKPFEVAELGSMLRLCVRGLDEELSKKLYYSSDRAIREFAAKYGTMPDRTDS